MKLEVRKTDGTSTGEQMELEPKVFQVDPNDHVLWLAVNAELTNRRQGNSSAKTRSEVSGGGKKPWRQKGRGTARAGSTRSPVWVGGGRAFGPEPRNYHKKLTKKLTRIARISALSHKAKEENILLVEDFNFEKPKTREMAAVIKNMELAATKILLLTGEHSDSTWRSCRNIPGVKVKQAGNFSTYDIMHADKLLIQKSALTKINEALIK